MPDNILKQYTYNRKGHRCGLLIGTSIKRKIVIGFSLCNLKLDKWNKELANTIAMNRMIHGSKEKIPHSLKHSYAKFKNRLKAYFKLNKPRKSSKKTKKA